MPVLFAPFLLPAIAVIALINITPDPVAIQLGPVPVLWYGVCYAVGLAATYWVITREARRRGLNAQRVDTGIVVIAIAALIGGRLYHVIDQWALYKDDLLTIFLPIQRTADGGYTFAGFSGLGVYGGIITGTIAAWLLIRHWHESFPKWADVIAPGLFVMQAIGRWGNFFNQELYGPPTTLPWGIAIDAQHRVPPYTDLATYPVATTGFHPLFLYESLSGILGAITLLWIARRWGPRMRPGDLVLIFFIWYAVVRFLLETLRTGNWTFNGIPTAMIVSAIVIVVSAALLVWRHRPAAEDAERWGEPPAPVDDRDVVEEIEVDDDELEDEVVDGDEVEIDEAEATDKVEGADDVKLTEVEPGDVEIAEAAEPDPTTVRDGAADDDDVEIVDDTDAPRGGG
jgi:phosphatidylglycerol:prolipoprotein diacylglycerol transferase